MTAARSGARRRKKKRPGIDELRKSQIVRVAIHGPSGSGQQQIPAAAAASPRSCHMVATPEVGQLLSPAYVPLLTRLDAGERPARCETLDQIGTTLADRWRISLGIARICGEAFRLAGGPDSVRAGETTSAPGTGARR